MDGHITLGVYRVQDNQQGMVVEPPHRALELHNQRKKALHDVLDQQNVVKVLSWGDTDDTHPHEYVEVVLGVIGAGVVQPLIIKGLQELAKKLAEQAVDEATSGVVKWLIGKLVKKQEKEPISDCHIRLKDGTTIRLDPPQGTSEITVHFKDGGVSTVKYSLGE